MLGDVGTGLELGIDGFIQEESDEEVWMRSDLLMERRRPVRRRTAFIQPS